jgi:hypothetical protein
MESSKPLNTQIYLIPNLLEKTAGAVFGPYLNASGWNLIISFESSVRIRYIVLRIRILLFSSVALRMQKNCCFFPIFFCLLACGSGSGRPKNMRVRIPITAKT